MSLNTFKKLAVVTVMSIGASFAAHAYPLAKVTNKTPYAASGTVHYMSAFCKNDKFSVAAGATWTASSRGSCLITGISASLAGAKKPVISYSSSGTSYSQFFISPAQEDFRVWSDAELAAENAKTREGKSPGFFIVNKTEWPISIALSQVGCLYYGTIPKGGEFKRNTGAVWFTIQVNVQPDGKEPRKDWDCVKPVLAVVGAVAVGAITGGYGAFAALPAATAATSIGAAGLTAIATSNTAMIAAGAATGVSSALATFGAKQLGELIGKNGAGELKGQYAGPDWPFRCDQMPVCHVTGGPRLGAVTLADGKTVPAFGEGTPLKITKQNSCGNSMM
jgi:hypothetical protein